MQQGTNYSTHDPDAALDQELRLQRRLDIGRKRYGYNPDGTPMSWTQRNEGTRRMSGVASYIFNVASILGLWYAVNMLIGPFLPIPYLSEVITTVLLVLFEITKRKFSDLFWDHWHRHLRVQWVYGVINFVLLFGISLVGSGFGVYFGVTDTSQEAKQIGINDDPEAIALSEEITEIDGKITQHQANTNPQGVIYWPSQKAIEALEKQRLENKEILKTKYGIYEVKNTEILQEWKLRKDFRAHFVIALVILMELLFEICMSFNSKYDWRAWLEGERKQTNAPPTPPHGSGPPRGGAKVRDLHQQDVDEYMQRLEQEAARQSDPPGPTDEHIENSCNRIATEVDPIREDALLEASYKHYKKVLNAWENKVQRGQGNEDTNRRHIAKLTEQMQYVEERRAAISAATSA